MLFRALELGPFLANCYIVGSDRNEEGIIIDPVAEAETIMDNVRQLGLTIKRIIATHSHPDHIMALGQIKEETGALFAMHEAESAGMIASGMARVMGMFMSGSAEPLPKPDMSLQDGEAIEVGDLSFTVLHTPGHSPGGISLYGHGMVFVGDTLFNFSIGRTDFPGCSHQQLIESINSKLLTLPDETIVYPGHGPQTTIRAERQHNPFLIG
jgi:glyoxylase-like metal-dependent hydrolase (beta-lactamase superfamily II)